MTSSPAGLRHRLALLFEISGQELLVVAAGNEADLLRVGLLGQREAVLARHFAHLGLGHVAQRKQRVRELLLRQPEEEVGLILGQIGGALQDPAAALASGRTRSRHSGRWRCGWRRWTARVFSKLIELEMVVAQRAGNRRAAGEILADEGPDDIPLEALFLVDDVVGNAEMLGHAARVIDIIERTAAAGLGRVGNAVLAGEARLVPKLQGEADDRCRRQWARIAATVEESTPPDMATAMVVDVVIRGNASCGLNRPVLRVDVLRAGCKSGVKFSALGDRLEICSVRGLGCTGHRRIMRRRIGDTCRHLRSKRHR